MRYDRLRRLDFSTNWQSPRRPLGADPTVKRVDIFLWIHKIKFVGTQMATANWRSVGR
jgi:hypothetical protein